MFTNRVFHHHLRHVCRGAIFLIAAGFLQAQGFGGMVGIKKTRDATLKRLLPATVSLNEKRIKVVASAATTAKVPADLLAILTTKLITTIQKDNRFVLDERNPETILKYTVTNYYVEERKTQATAQVPACTYYTGKIEVSYQAIESGSNAPIDSENLEHAITEEQKKSSGIKVPLLNHSNTGCSSEGKGTANEARDALVDAIVKQMAHRAAPFEEDIIVPVPGGKLEPLSALAISQRWGKLLEEAEKTEPLPKPADDAYRLYLIGLANEALAYQDARDAGDLEKARRGDTTSDKAKQSMAQEDKDFKDAQDYLDKAGKAYKDALTAKSSEKEFRSPDARMEEAVKLYETINRHKLEYQEAVAKRTHTQVASASAAGSRSAGSEPAAKSGYDQVIGMCQSHDTDIAQMITDHPTELAFTKGLTLAEDQKLKRECGADYGAIRDAIKNQVSKRAAH